MTTLAQARPVDGERGRPFGLRLRRRYVWLVPGLGIALFANAQAGQHDLGLAPLLIFGIVPHLTAALGIGQPHAPGQMAPRAVPLFNAMHQPVVPLLVLGLAVASVLPPFWLVGALAWLSHIVVDRAFGDRTRDADGYLPGIAVGNSDRIPIVAGAVE
jgi:hypothetical protein